MKRKDLIKMSDEEVADIAAKSPYGMPRKYAVKELLYRIKITNKKAYDAAYLCGATDERAAMVRKKNKYLYADCKGP